MLLKSILKEHREISKALENYSTTKELAQKTEQSIAFHQDQSKILQARKKELATEYNEKWKISCHAFIAELKKIQEKTGISDIYFDKDSISKYVPIAKKASIEIKEHVIAIKAEYEYRNPDYVYISDGCSPEIGLAPAGSIEGFAADLLLGTNASAIDELTAKIVDAIDMQSEIMYMNMRAKARELSESVRKDKEAVNLYEKKLEQMSRANGIKSEIFIADKFDDSNIEESSTMVIKNRDKTVSLGR